MTDFKQRLRNVGSQVKGWLFRPTMQAHHDDAGRPLKYKVIGGCVIFYCLIVLGFGFYWSGEPEVFSLSERVEQELPVVSEQSIRGVYTTVSLIHVAETLMEKSGGYISNDVFPPGVYLDNIPNWEYGVIIQVRDFVKAMREAFSRSQSQSTEDKDLAMAESRFNFDHRSWMLPASEKEYAEGIKYLRSYLNRLVDTQQQAQFYSRSDNLRYWLSTVETRLGSISQRLTASVGQKRINTDLAGETESGQSTYSPEEVEVKTPWSEIDDNFYEARGSAWALIHLLKAIDQDFAEVLEKKNARISLQQIIRELEQTQETVFSPVILNGSGFGFVANHSLVMASYISRANAALIDLRELLSQG